MSDREGLRERPGTSALELPDRQRRETPLELYLHIPFCVRKCAYCDFLSFSAGEEEQRLYVQGLVREIKSVAQELRDAGDCREISTLFIGGGTPSAIREEYTGEILDHLKKEFHLSPEAEITTEANPGTLTKEKLACYREKGINRLSLGLQSPDNRELKELGRIHTFEEFLESFSLAREAGFDNINVDLMFALPFQTREGWRASLKRTAQLGPEHISAYSLIVEEGTPFAKRELVLPDEDTEYDMYEDTALVLGEYRYRQYEISNYGKKGFICRHNVGYWKRYDYLGLGLGAASLYGSRRFSNTGSMKEYLNHSSCPGKLRREETVLSIREQMEEFMFLGLRMTEGICQEDFCRQFGVSLREVYGGILEKYKSMGFLEQKGSFWRFSRKGIHVSNQILAEFLL